jgi:hypothetical protein
MHEGTKGDAMRFPEQAREGSEAHTDALRRQDEARDHQRDMSDAFAASKGTPNERGATVRLAAATEQTAAREAWVSWIERGY